MQEEPKIVTSKFKHTPVLLNEVIQAISQIPTEKKELKGKIVEEIESGYLLNEKIIRFTKVVIGK